ncbi:MAG: hypothetical protein LBV45_07960 [Xanthomonadaceae bacterium]|jgi:hypothetical protein|nr:hypothetical protein [Xanthomonadaceae bacterium]
MNNKSSRLVSCLLSICAIMFLPGCASMMLSYSAKGKTLEQLMESKRSVKSIKHNNSVLYCYNCDGRPTRTYTSKAGNPVAVYSYWAAYDYPVACSWDAYSGDCSGGYSKCLMAEEHYVFKDGVVADTKIFTGQGNRAPLYSPACDGYSPQISDTDL